MAETSLIQVGISVACGLACLAWYTLVVDLLARGYPRKLRLLAAEGESAESQALPRLSIRATGGLMRVLRESSARTRIERSFPEVIDLILVCVDAGMNLHSALKYVAHVTGGPLGDRLKRSVHVMSTGRGLRDALKELSGNDSSPAVRFFVTTMGFSYLRGNPMSEALRAQAWMARQRKRRSVEASVRAMPTKIVVCSIVFFMPAILAVTVLPAVLVFLGSKW